MLPAPNHPVWSQIATGKKPVTSAKLAINLLIQNCKIEFQRDSSPANAAQLATRVHRFFQQNEKVFPDEIKRILA